MALKTTLEQIEEVQAAISDVMAGQEVFIAGKRITLANLKDLEAREQRLLARYHQEQGRGPAVNVGLPRRD